MAGPWNHKRHHTFPNAERLGLQPPSPRSAQLHPSMATRLVVDGTMRRVTGSERPSFGYASGVDSAAEFFRFVAMRAGLPLESTADVLIADYAMVLGASDGLAEESTGGLDKKELAALTTIESGGVVPDGCSDCPVCFSSFAEMPARLLPCSHAFCEDCTTRWMASHTTCPMCRLDCRFVNGFAPFKPRRRRALPSSLPDDLPPTSTAAASAAAADASALAESHSPLEAVTTPSLGGDAPAAATPTAGPPASAEDCRLSSPRLASPRLATPRRTGGRAAGGTRASAASPPLSPRAGATSTASPRTSLPSTAVTGRSAAAAGGRGAAATGGASGGSRGGAGGGASASLPPVGGGGGGELASPRSPLSPPPRSPPPRSPPPRSPGLRGAHAALSSGAQNGASPSAGVRLSPAAPAPTWTSSYDADAPHGAHHGASSTSPLHPVNSPVSSLHSPARLASPSSPYSPRSPPPRSPNNSVPASPPSPPLAAAYRARPLPLPAPIDMRTRALPYPGPASARLETRLAASAASREATHSSRRLMSRGLQPPPSARANGGGELPTWLRPTTSQTAGQQPPPHEGRMGPAMGGTSPRASPRVANNMPRPRLLGATASPRQRVQEH